MSTTTVTDVLPELERVLASHASELMAKGVRSVHLVGSHARGTAKPNSDIDLLIDLAPALPSASSTSSSSRTPSATA